MAGSVGATIAPFYCIQTVSGNSPSVRRLPENALKTFVQGAPLVFSAGYLQESAAIAADTTKIVGFANENAHNLASAGVGGSGATFGSVQNMASGKNIIVGSPPQDGNIGVEIAVDDNLFVGYTDLAHTLAVTDVGTAYGLTKDAVSGFWFVDTTITAGNGAILVIVGLYDPAGTLSGRVIFKVAKANQVLIT